MEIKRVFIVGAGLMGSGIAQVCAKGSLDEIQERDGIGTKMTAPEGGK